MKKKIKYYLQAIAHRYYMGKWPEEERIPAKAIIDRHFEYLKDSTPRRG